MATAGQNLTVLQVGLTLLTMQERETKRDDLIVQDGDLV